MLGCFGLVFFRRGVIVYMDGGGEGGRMEYLFMDGETWVLAEGGV